MSSTPPFSFAAMPELVCAAGAAADLGRHLRGGFPHRRRALLVTDGDLFSAGVAEAPLRSLQQHGFSAVVYGGVVANPPEAVARHAVEFARRHDIDVVVGLGGGSAMDVAKLAAVMANGNQVLTDLYAGENVNVRALPIVQIPTTYSGAESSDRAFVTAENGAALVIQARQLKARGIILDPALTHTLDATVTAESALDAMAGAIEAYTCARNASPLASMLAREAIGLLSRNLVKVCESGSDPAARRALLLGAHLAGQAANNARDTPVHALAAPLTTRFGIPLRLATAMMLPHVMRFLLARYTPAYAELAAVVAPHVDGSEAARAEALVVAVQQLAKITGIAGALEQIGASAADVGALADTAAWLPQAGLDHASILAIYQSAF